MRTKQLTLRIDVPMLGRISQLAETRKENISETIRLLLLVGLDTATKTTQPHGKAQK